MGTPQSKTEENLLTRKSSDSKEKIEIKFNYENKTIYSNTYSIFISFKRILKDFKKNIANKYPNICNKNNEINYLKKNGDSININSSLFDIFNYNDLDYTVLIEFCGLDSIPLDSNKYILHNLYLVGKPIFQNKFKVYTYNNKTISFTKLHFSMDNINESEINCFSEESSYCNGDNNLYIYGGTKNNNLIGIFWIIDLKKGYIEKVKPNIELKPKSFHSLIYIPSKYIFIIGGKINDNVMYYDIIKKEFKYHGNKELNLIEPSLIFINDTYLYAISNINQLNMYRINLRVNPNWERIIPKMPSTLSFKQRFFGLCKTDYNSFIFIGGETNENEHVFEYNYIKNEMTQTTLLLEKFDFPEKTFLPFSSWSFLLIPSIEQKTLRLVTFNTLKEEIKVIHFNDKVNNDSELPNIDKKNKNIESIFNLDFNFYSLPDLSIPDETSIHALRQSVIRKTLIPKENEFINNNS